MVFLETTQIVKVTISISVSRLLYLTDPIRSTRRYNNHNGFRDILGFICSARGLLEGPGLDSDTFILRESSGNHPGIKWDPAGLPGLARLAGQSRILWFINKNQYKVYSLKRGEQNLIVAFTQQQKTIDSDEYRELGGGGFIPLPPNFFYHFGTTKYQWIFPST